MTPQKAYVAATEVVHTPPRPKGKPIEDYQMPWTERIARSRAKAPVRRLSAGEERRTLRYASDVQEERDGDEWERTHYPTQHGHNTMLFGLPTTITQRSDALEDGDVDEDWDQDYVPFSATAPSFWDGDKDNDRLGRQELRISPMTEYRKYSFARDEIFSPFTNHTHELGTTGDFDLEQPMLSMRDQLTNAFALHALNQCMEGGFRNEFANVGQTAKPPLKLTQKPRTKIEGHNAYLWLKNYKYDSFLDCTKALILHEEQTVGFPKVVSHLASHRPRFGASIEIMRDSNKVTTVKINEDFTSSKKRYEKSVLPMLKLTGPDKPRIRVHTRDLKCNFDCDCYETGELTFTAPDIGSLRVNIDWGRCKSHNGVISNSVEFEHYFLDLLFPLAMFSPLAPFDIQLPDGGPVHRVFRTLDESQYATMRMVIQKALNDLAGRVRKENIREKEVKVWVGEVPQSQKSPDRVRAEGTFFVCRPARSTQFTYDAPYTMRRFLAQARAQLYPDTPANELRLMISPSKAARDAGQLLTPIAEREGGYEEPDENGRTAEDYWKDEYLGPWLNAEEDIWAIKVFDSIKVLDGTPASEELLYWDTRPPLHSTVSLHETSSNLADGLAEISKDLLDIDPRSSEVGIVLHVKRPESATQRKEWLKWSSDHSFNHFLLDVFYKIDSSEIVIYPGNYSEAVSPLSPTQVAENMARFKGKAMDRKRIQLVDPMGLDLFPEDIRSLPPAEERPQTHPSQASSASEIRRLREENDRLQAQIEHREEACRVCGRLFPTEGEGPVALQEHYKTHGALPRRECPHEGCQEDLEDRARYPDINMVLDHVANHGQVKRCQRIDCHCPLYLLNPRQLDAHNRLHPHESSTRPPSTNPGLASPTENRGTQTGRDTTWREPTVRSTSLDELPDPDNRRERCAKCQRPVDKMSQESRQEHARKCNTRVENFENSTIRLRAKAYETVPSTHPEAPESSRAAATRSTAATSSATDRPTRQRNAPTRGGRKAATQKQPNQDRALADALVGTVPTESAVQGNGDAPSAGTTTSTAPVMPGSSTMPPPASSTKTTSRKRPAPAVDQDQTPSEEPPAKKTKTARAATAEAVQLPPASPTKKTSRKRPASALDQDPTPSEGPPARRTRAATAEAAQLPVTSAPAAPLTQGPAQNPTVKKTTSRKRRAEDEPAADNTTAEQPKPRGRPPKKAKTALGSATGGADPTDEPTGQRPKRPLRLRPPRPEPEAGLPPPPGNDPPAPPPPPSAKAGRKKPAKKPTPATAPSTATEQPPSSQPPPTQQVPSVEPAAMPAPEGQLAGDAAAAAPAAPKKAGRKPRAKKAEKESAADAGASGETGGGEAVEEQEGQAEETDKGKRTKKPTAKAAEKKKGPKK